MKTCWSILKNEDIQVIVVSEFHELEKKKFTFTKFWGALPIFMSFIEDLVTRLEDTICFSSLRLDEIVSLTFPLSHHLLLIFQLRFSQQVVLFLYFLPVRNCKHS